MPYNSAALGTNQNKVRLLIPDTDTANELFDDDEIDAFLSLHSSNIYLAAAEALEVAATNEALRLKVQKIVGLETDGAKLLDAIRKRVRSLRERGASGEGEATFGGFAIASPVLTPQQAVDVEWNQALRSG